jgi:cupin 2 domain-containing protein
MASRIANIFADLSRALGQEQFLTLFENDAVTIERIVSRCSSSPPGFWYDQPRDEWVIMLRGHATLEFEGGELFEMREGDYLPSRAVSSIGWLKPMRRPSGWRCIPNKTSPQKRLHGGSEHNRRAHRRRDDRRGELDFAAF